MLNTNQRIPRFGDVYLVRLDGSGSEQRGLRPAVVFQNNIGNLHSPNVTLLPMTSQIKKSGQPTHVIIEAKWSGLLRDSMVLCENPVCISKEKLGAYLTSLSTDHMVKITEANLLASSAIAVLQPDILIGIRDKAIMLNGEHSVQQLP